MFRVIRINRLIDFDFNIDTHLVIGYEQITPKNITLIYCFSTNLSYIHRFFESLKQKGYLIPQSYHDIYYKEYYFDDHITITSSKSDIKLFENIKFLKDQYFIFLETKMKRQMIKVKLEFTTIEELKDILREQYQIKFLIPFFYSNREMKEFKLEKKIKVKDLSILYILENKTLEGKKR